MVDGACQLLDIYQSMRKTPDLKP